MATFTWERDKNRVIIKPQGFAENLPLQKLPSKRWKQTSGEYVVPFTRMNAEALIGSVLKTQMDPALLQEFERYSNATVGSRQFPRWYKYKTTPLPNQIEAVDKLYRNDVGAALMPMGTGKSKVLIDIQTAHFYERRIQAMVLLAPLTTTGVWAGDQGQLAIHSPVPTKVVHVDSSFDWTRHRPSSEEMLWLTVGLESLSNGKTADKLKPFLEHHKCGIAVDESHWIKNRNAIRTERAVELGKLCAYRNILTGTLATRNMVDIFSQYDWLDPNIIGVGDWFAFRNRYCLMGGFKMKEVVGYDNVEELMGLLEPYTYICDVPKGLPEQIFMPPRQVRMTDEQFAYYQKVRKAEMEGISVANVLNKVLKLHQICGGHLFEDPKKIIDPLSQKEKKVPGKLLWSLPPPKNPKIQEMLDVTEQEPNRQMIVWAKYLPEIADCAEALRPLGRVAVITGAVPLVERQEIVEDFQAKKYKFLVCNQQTAGVSWTLTAATINHYYSNTEKLDDRLQSEKRSHRHGQTQGVLYQDYEMRTPKGGRTVDSILLASIAAKKDLDVFIRDSIKAAGGKIEDVLI